MLTVRMPWTLTCALAGLILSTANAAELDPALVPTEAGKPWAYMWRNQSSLTAEDLSRHIAQLKDKGFGGFIVYGGNPNKVAKMLLPQMLQECEKHGLIMGANNCESWPSGGTWMSRENKPWMTISSTYDIDGGKPFSGTLPQPLLSDEGDEQFTSWLAKQGVATIAVQAYRLPPGPMGTAPIITASSHPERLPALFDGNWNTSWIPDRVADPQVKHPWVLFDYGSPRPIEAIWYDSRASAQVQVSDDQVSFKTIFASGGTVGYAEFPVATARYVRVLFPGLDFEKRVYGRVNELAVGTRGDVQRRALIATKCGLMGVYWPWLPSDRGYRLPFTTAHYWMRENDEFVHEPLLPSPGDLILPSAGTIDLSDKVGSDGSLQWDPPPGRWRVVWLRRSLVNSMENMPDLLNSAASKEDFEKGMGAMGAAAGDKAGTLFRCYHEDNNEIHSIYNWTPNMLEQFRTRRGYEPKPYLAALAGQIVDSAEVTDRFLNDVRRTVADCVAEHHYQVWHDLASKQGVLTRAEAGGPYLPFTPSHDVMANLSRVDIPVGEFWSHSSVQHNWARIDGKLIDPTASIWQRYKWRDYAKLADADALRAAFDDTAQNINVKMAASTAHIYGKPIVDTEAFTSLMNVNAITLSSLLPRANVAFCEGVNHMCFHASDTTSAAEGAPGTVYAAGTYFNDKNTWWPYVGAFTAYIQRCSSPLQRGKFVADLLYYIGDEAPAIISAKRIRAGGTFGYDYDDCNSEALLTRFSVKDGRLVTPEGMSYRVLVLPDRRTMPLAVARKIRELVQAGAVVVGPRPTRTPGLTGYPDCDRELQAIVDELWNSGKVIDGTSERDVLAAVGVPVDFAYACDRPDALLDYIHRQDGETDIYFVINRRNRTEQVDLTFRMTGKEPDCYDPLSDRHWPAAAFTMDKGRTTVPVELPPYGSLFVSFRTRVAETKRAGKPFSELTEVAAITGPWTVRFDPKRGGPQEPVVFPTLTDWTASDVEGIKHYSGTAVYEARFALPRLPNPGARVLIDLGAVKDLAAVRINGTAIGVTWCPPWRLAIGQGLQTGTNVLEIEVTNTWHNRLQLDQLLPEDKRIMDFGVKLRGDTFKPRPAQPLVPAGLLGPVRLLSD